VVPIDSAKTSRISFRKVVAASSLVVAFSVAASSVPVNASLPSNKCTKVGAKKRVKSVAFVCAKSGKKLVWVKQSSNKSGKAPSATSTAPVTPTNWTDLEKYASAIPYASWRESAAAIAAGVSKAPTPQYLNGANVVITNASPNTACNRTEPTFWDPPKSKLLAIRANSEYLIFLPF